MASENNLNAVFTDIANAIRDKKGSVNTIKPINMADEILTISSGEEDTSGTKFYKYTKPTGGVAIPNDGTPISKIYLNINFTNVVDYIKSLGLTFYEMNGLKFYPFLFDSATYDAYLILEDGTIEVINFVDPSKFKEWFVNYGSSGSSKYWCLNNINTNGVNGVIELSTPITPISEFNGIPVGTENEKIKSIISFDNSIGVEKEKCSNEDILSGNVNEIESDITSIRYGAFADYYNLKKVNLSNANVIDQYAFSDCQELQNISLPLVEEIGASAFLNSWFFESAYLSKIKRLGNGGDAFRLCNSLKAVIIEQTETICTLYSSNAFSNCAHFTGEVVTSFNPNGDKDGFVYVPDSLVEQYKVAPIWSNIASQIKPLSELPQKYKDLYNIK